jgi:hypothetical protein
LLLSWPARRRILPGRSTGVGRSEEGLYTGLGEMVYVGDEASPDG